MRIANGKVFDGQCFRERDVVVEGQIFSSIETSGDVACGAGGAGRCAGRFGMLCDPRPDRYALPRCHGPRFLRCVR